MARSLMLLILAFHLNIAASHACTIFMFSDGKSVMVGNNEDNTPTLKSYLWYNPKKDSKYGYVTWGNIKNMPEGGMNEKGLFWDAAAMSQRIPIIVDESKEKFKGYFVEKALSECATVEELVSLVSKYNLMWQEKAQIFVADASGDYAIIHCNYIIRKASVGTNYFSLANYCIKPPGSSSTQCHRQGYAQRTLTTEKKVSAELLKNILAKTAQTEIANATLYSQICNLKKGTIQLFQKYNFDEKKELRLKDELEKGERTVEIKEYFPKSIAEELSPFIERQDYAGAKQKYLELKVSSPKSFSFLFRHLDDLGFKYLRENKREQAMEVFKLNQEHFPQSDLALSSLACVYLAMNDTANAYPLFDRAKAINPNNYHSNIFKPRTKGKVRFIVNHFEGVDKLSIAGSFNEWKPEVNVFTKDKNGVWICEINLPPGEYRYKMVVGDGNWYADPLNKYMFKSDKYWDNYLKVEF